jgi:hypothetical protein
MALERALLKASGGSGFGQIIHFTCGVHPRARYTGGSFIEDSRVFGYSAIGMGRPFWAQGGGENHPDGIMARTCLWIDGELVVRDGVIVGPPYLAKRAAEVIQSSNSAVTPSTGARSSAPGVV